MKQMEAEDEPVKESEVAVNDAGSAEYESDIKSINLFK